MSKYYYHGLGEAFYRGDSLNRILKILKTGGIKCKRLLGLPNIYESTWDSFIMSLLFTIMFKTAFV